MKVVLKKIAATMLTIATGIVMVAPVTQGQSYGSDSMVALPVAPQVSNVDVTPRVFNPQHNEEATVTFYLNERSEVTFSVSTANSVSVERNINTVVSGEWFDAGYHSLSWDGRDYNDSNVVAGYYDLTLDVSNRTGEDSFSTYVNVEYDNENERKPLFSGVKMTPSTFDPTRNQVATLSYSLNQPAKVEVTISRLLGDAALPVKKLVNNSEAIGAQSVTWDGQTNEGTLAEEGSYIYEATATNSNGTDVKYGNITVKNNNVTVEGPVAFELAPTLSNVYISQEKFDPHTESVNINYTVNSQAYVTVEILEDFYSIRRILDGDDGLNIKGSHTVYWDGMRANGELVNNGYFRYRVTARNLYGTDVKSGFVQVEFKKEIKNKYPYSKPYITNVTTFPSQFNPKFDAAEIEYRTHSKANVRVEIQDFHSNETVRVLENETKAPGFHTALWKGEDNNGKKVREGLYRYVVKARNPRGSDERSGSLKVDYDLRGQGRSTLMPLISHIAVTNGVFNPEQKEEVKVRYALSTTSTLSATVHDKDGKHVASLINSARIPDGFGRQVKWNGHTDDQYIVDNGTYTIKMIAVNRYGKDEKNVTVKVNNGLVRPYSETCGDFDDIRKDTELCEATQFVRDENIFKGYADGFFHADRPINRAEFTKVVLKAFEVDIEKGNGTNLGFRDLDPNAWYAPFVQTAQTLGVIEGYLDQSFRPASNLNRAEALKVFLEASGVDVPGCEVQPYVDTPKNTFNAWYFNYVCFSKDHGLVDDTFSGQFEPASDITRGDVAKLFYRFYRAGYLEDSRNRLNTNVY